MKNRNKELIMLIFDILKLVIIIVGIAFFIIKHEDRCQKRTKLQKHN